MRIMDSSEDPTMMAVSDAELSQGEDTALEEASQLSCLSVSTPSRISGRQDVFQRHIFAGADISFGFCSMGWLGRLRFFSPQQNLKFPSPQQIFCCVFPSFNPIDVPKQASITDVPYGENNRFDGISLSQQTQLSTEFSNDVFSPKKSPSSERKLMSRAQRQRQVAFVAQQQLLIDLITLEPHEYESMKEAADDTFALLDNLGANDRQFCEHIWDFISLTSSVAQMNTTIEDSLSPEEHSKCLEEEKAKFAHIHSLYVKTEALFQASDQCRQSLCKEISHFEAVLLEKQSQLKSYELETSNIEIELGDLRRNMLESDTALKARAEQAKVARKLREERKAKQIAAKTALEKAILELEY
ncbi:hypothetical protein E2542_SST12825 [Spatholobus suberectus]|nr:hypothetical protein E2542_SST12825 [Spatholobus suberectus]